MTKKFESAKRTRMEFDEALREVARITARVRCDLDQRDAIIREVLTRPDIKHGDMSKMAEAAGVTRGRVSQIVKRAKTNADA